MLMFYTQHSYRQAHAWSKGRENITRKTETKSEKYDGRGEGKERKEAEFF
jgi:hypothetical protein